LEWRSLDHLRPPGRGSGAREGRMAVQTRCGLEAHDRIDFVHRHSEAGMARLARLTTTTACPPRAPQTLGLGRVARWGAGSMRRGLGQLCMHRADLLLSGVDHGRQSLYTSCQRPHRGWRFGRNPHPNVRWYCCWSVHGDRVRHMQTSSPP
jgi:hypothetical protein